MSKSEIDKIKAVLSEINKPKLVKQWWLLFHDTKPELNFISAIARVDLKSHVQQHVISIEDYRVAEDRIKKLTRALEVAVDALSNTFPGEYGKDIKNHNDDYLNKIAEILEVK